ncbi:hypothetical protein M2277_004947 [Paenibacillus sp. LBL]|uniref:hypothetical protein n=1 Tax=Paenibacillus sp. LBL TaxID=2940563 RepID=UPI0024743287|nr:hypothetical protein [Paenibacillus sp. LBL]MDH6674255.1 hypothetical protein [Paenibacillus sp. LBL]
MEHIKKQIIDGIQKFNKDFNSLSSWEYNAKKYGPPLTAVEEVFGSWNDAISAAGFTPNRPAMLTKEEATNTFLTHLRSHPEIVSRKNYIELSLEPSPSRLTKPFNGSWRNLLLHIGMDVNTKNTKKSAT